MSSQHDEKSRDTQQKATKNTEKVNVTASSEVKTKSEKGPTTEKIDGVNPTSSVSSTPLDVDKEEKTPERPLYSLENFDNPRRFIRSDDYRTELGCLKTEYMDKYKDLYPRKMNSVKSEDKNKQHLKIMQFNVLADGLSGLYSNSQKDDKAFIGTPQGSLEFNFRGFRVVEEIMRHDPDIVTMEEVDQFEFFQHYLKGYKGYHSPKKSSPCLEIGTELNKKMLPDGVATFFKTKQFKLVNSRLFGKQRNENEKVDVPAVMLHLRWLQSKSSGLSDFVVVSTHLKSAKDMKGEQLRLEQISYLSKELLDYQKKVEKEIHSNVPIFIGCDLNAPPKDTKGFPPLTYASIVDDNWFKTLIKQNKEKQNDQKIEVDLNKYQEIYNGLQFSSAYKVLSGQEPSYTTWKKRKGGEDKHTIDYLFFQKYKGVEVTSLLEIPGELTVNRESLIPGWEYPSDHFSLMAVFEF